jgi:DNA-binding MarR family transcriptional regulator
VQPVLQAANLPTVQQIGDLPHDICYVTVNSPERAATACLSTAWWAGAFTACKRAGRATADHLPATSGMTSGYAPSPRPLRRGKLLDGGRYFSYINSIGSLITKIGGAPSPRTPFFRGGHAMKVNPPVPLEQARTVAALLRSLLRELTAGVDDPAVELPLAQLRVCNMLSGGPRAMSALGRELGVSLSAITQIADRLERARLVKRVSQGNDRRVRCLQLTDRGATMMDRHEEARVQRMSAALQNLTPKARGAVAVSLESLVRASAATRNHNGDSETGGSHSATSKVLL